LVLTLALVGCSQSGSVAPAQVRAQSESNAKMAAAVTQGDQAQFRQADTNGDQALSRAELAWMPSAAFDALDANHNGALSFEEAVSQAPDTVARAQEAEDFAKAASGQAGNVTQAIAQGTLAAKAPAQRVGNPIIEVPGYLDLPAFFIPITKKLEAQGRDVTYLGLFPNMADIRNQAATLAKKVEEVKARTGAKQVDIIGHSMGGLISRYYIKNLGGEKNVSRLIQLATPNHGTIVALAGPGKGADQMHPGSDFLNELNATDETPGAIAYTSIRGGLDEIVIPHDSPILDGADNQFCRFAAHGSIFLDPSAWGYLQNALKK
jgi:pimeloyl-ACP methyl ester carboxylesterase